MTTAAVGSELGGGAAAGSGLVVGAGDGSIRPASARISWSAGAAGPRYLAAAMGLIEAVEQHFVFADKENNAVLKNGTVTYPLAGISIVSFWWRK